jgi:hypothetical protein
MPLPFNRATHSGGNPCGKRENAGLRDGELMGVESVCAAEWASGCTGRMHGAVWWNDVVMEVRNVPYGCVLSVSECELIVCVCACVCVCGCGYVCVCV